MILIVILITNFLFLLIKHPLTNGMILLLQTILISMITGMMNMNFWYSYILFLIMIGGMLVLFIYMTSIASNEKFKFNTSITISMFLSLITIMIFFWVNFLFDEYKQLSDMNLLKYTNFTISMNKYLILPNNFIFMIMIIYLFITLIAIVKITHFSYGPLRQKL